LTIITSFQKGIAFLAIWPSTDPHFQNSISEYILNCK
jgi:hypothetical protein